VASATHGSGLVTVVFLVRGLLIAALSSAACRLATVLSELRLVAEAVTSVMFAIVIAIFISVAFLPHHWRQGSSRLATGLATCPGTRLRQSPERLDSCQK
jgi:hypothetical protein